MFKNRKELYDICEGKLLNLRDSYKRTLASPRSSNRDGVDLIDLANGEVQIQSSNYFRARLRYILPEIEAALVRIEEGTYGICEVSGEEIESGRLLAVPWTKVSIDALSELEAS